MGHEGLDLHNSPWRGASRSGRVSLQLTQPVVPPAAAPSVGQGRHQRFRGTWRLSGFSRPLWGVEPGLGLPSSLLLGPPPSRVGPHLPHRSTWAQCAHGPGLPLVSSLAIHSFAGKGLDYSRNLWMGRRGQPLTPCCPSGLGSGLLGNQEMSPSSKRPQWHRAVPS